MKRMLLCIAVLVVSTANAAYIVNGDFESPESAFTGWGHAAATVAPVAISGERSIKMVRSSGGNLSQSLSVPLSVFEVSFDLAISDPGSSTNRSFQLNLYHSVGPDQNVNMRVVRGTVGGMGTIEVFQQGVGWQVAVANALTFSADDQDLRVNHIAIVGDYTDSPFYTIAATDSGGTGHMSSPLTAWQNSNPIAGGNLVSMKFDSSNLVSGSFFVVDNVSVIPEPATLMILGLGGLLGLRRRTR